MSEHTNLAQMRAKPGRSEALGAALQSLVAPSRDEPGCIIYQVHQSTEDPALWMVYEVWQSADDLGDHFTLPHMQAFVASVPELVDGDLDLKSFTRVGPTA
ncbi:putative quinol monooxygenase [Novosphingobium panipatense]|uniref:Quinol monooxygenase YgiN n=1 Tax=Novosphingobium panipatense TaxID=428991 RepID=A0ABY1QV26_9SPHN|nr:putative quinol monooxygenase [Novosphingobium panipatense]SMP81173.1 Quinol monooxygenase YgiN [Novosphingobium panipatense]